MEDMRACELTTLVEEEGLCLPYPVSVILGLENHGYYVDLRTGLIGDSREQFSLTPAGDAWLIVLAAMADWE